MRKCKCDSNYCSHARKSSVDSDYFNTKNSMTIPNENNSKSPDISKRNRSRSVSPNFRKSRSRSRSKSLEFRSNSRSPSRKRKHYKHACKHIMFKTSKALCNPKLRKKYAKKLLCTKKKSKKN